MNGLKQTANRLLSISQNNYLNPHTALIWPETMELNQWFMAPELISVYGNSVYEELSEKRKKELSFWEAVNFFSLNIHGEKALVEGLAQRLYRRELTDVAEYLHSFLDEENKHMIYFGGFCQRYAGKIYRDRKLKIEREYAYGEEEFLFFAKTMIFEELADYYNLRMGNNPDIELTARRINLIHHLEEARHLAFGREIVRYLFNKFAPNWTGEVLQNVRNYLLSYLEATWKEYYNPDVYRDAGLDEVFDLLDQAWNSSASKKHRQQASFRCMDFFVKEGILEKNLVA